MMKYILFLLTEYYYEIACLRRKEILERAGAGGAVVTLQKLNLCSVEEACKRLSAKENISLGEILALTDDPLCLQQLLDKGCFAIAIYHEMNADQVFSGARYAVEDIFSLEYRSYEEAFCRLAGLPWSILKTERLWVRESMVSDVVDFYRIYQDPSITYYMKDLFPEKESEIAYMKSYIEQIYGFYGFGLWTVILKESGEVIGRAGLSVREGYEIPELGFVIDVPHQKKGYAHEVCEAILQYAREELAFEEVQALVDEKNENSLRLLKKLGFVFDRDVIESDRHYKLFIKKL